MLVRYRMNSSCTLSNMRADIDKIIRGLATGTGDLSAGCDSANTQFFGTYPSGKYVRVGTGATTDTYSKIHSDYSDVTHYFRLTYDASKLVSLTLAQGYTSGTDTLVNSREITKYQNRGSITASFSGNVMTVNDTTRLYLGNTLAVGDILSSSYDNTLSTGVNLSNSETTGNASISGSTAISAQGTGTGTTGTYFTTTTNAASNTYWQVYRPVSANIGINTYNANINPHGIDIVVSSKMIYLSSPYNGTQLGIFDIGKNGVSRIYTSNMLMAGMDVEQEVFGITIPYTYKFSTNTYGAQTNLSLNYITPQKRFNSSSALIVIENPTFVFQEDNGSVLSVVYGLLKLPENTYASHITYADSGSVRRLTINDYAILTE
jgi:hypothetical protein